MANQYTLDNDFAAIAEPQGTLYNVGDSAIELADADTTPKGQGILLMTGERRTFNGTLYARSMDTAATLNVSDFTEAAGGGESSSIPTGTLINYSASGSNPIGYLECNGAPVSRAMYPDLFDIIGTQYGPGDGSTTFNLPDLTNSAIMNGENDKTTITTPGSGTFTPPHDGWYKITLQGGGGGGSGAGTVSDIHLAGSGGGSGAHITTYEKLTAGVSYSYVVGAGGAGSTAGTSSSQSQDGANGGATTITIGSSAYSAGGGVHAYGSGTYARPGAGGSATLNGQAIPGKGFPGGAGSTTSSINAPGGNGGGAGGAEVGWVASVYGSGGGGGQIGSDGTYGAGGNGGDGYVVFEYVGTPIRVLIKAFDNQTPESALIDITQYAQELANKLNRNGYIPGAFNKKETFTTSGSFTAPVTGVYRITLQGGGGGGGGAGTYDGVHGSGGGGGQGGYGVFYENLTAGTSYSFTIGAGGSGGTAGSASTAGTNGSNGGDSQIVINSVTYKSTGGGGGGTATSSFKGGICGGFYVDSTIMFRGASGAGGTITSSHSAPPGAGGGAGGSSRDTIPSYYGGGGCGGEVYWNSVYGQAWAGGNGYISFEYYDTNA